MIKYYDKYLEYINEYYYDSYSYLRVKSVLIDSERKSVYIKLLVPSTILDSIFTDKDKENINIATKDIIPKEFSFTIEYISCMATEIEVMKELMNFINKKFRAIEVFVKESLVNVTIIDEVINICFKVTEDIEHYLSNGNFVVEFARYFSHTFTNRLIVSYERLDEEVDFVPTDTIEIKRASHFIDVEVLDKIFGRSISLKPVQIKSIKSDDDNVAICGTMMSFTKIMKKSDNTPFYKFTIDDSIGNMGVVLFPRLYPNSNAELFARNKQKYEDLIKVLDSYIERTLDEKISVICQGKVSFSNYSNSLEMIANGVYSAIIDKSSIQTAVLKLPYPSQYSIVIPDRYQDTKINDCYIPPNQLADKRVVVFDFETTGLYPERDTPIELGAVSIENGRITEIFSTFINPQIPISNEITKLTSITDDMVENAPIISEVIPDFYKFVNGDRLVAHNIDFDWSFLNANSYEKGYIFDGDRHDTLQIARARITGLANYQLSTVCEYFGIINEGAHRAIYDAISTARLYIELLK